MKKPPRSSQQTSVQGVIPTLAPHGGLRGSVQLTANGAKELPPSSGVAVRRRASRIVRSSRGGLDSQGCLVEPSSRIAILFGRQPQ
jgi:hypothetical protein